MRTTPHRRRGNVATGIIDYGWYLNRASQVVVVTRDATRHGVTYADDVGSTPVAVAEQRVRDALEDAGLPCGADCAVSASLGAVGDVPSMSVSVSAPYSPITGLIPMPAAIKVRLTMALELRDPS